ncbi:hypothetical protein CGCF415_v010005 [Colletotrichum fructicola]|uniref:Uncharacterized protein n=1 Tax=Colletotrichum fructicola (strain Nara gc5) TaxID=1213859 RepID=L2FQQ4_COLFN|nr:uncharacterized protein CGMCC3_g8889 [Colletotrichum fructicola]KAF4479212.1 hypothetical protein CGGC5_v012949 [Colletotrichum fructicola Nara gc5]KAE9574829.1 hypothetical protein CGMCC3_g8889 [Colletotrichum fructicola]KAF4422740.1 hypothetical protein CFRS1_v001487 [Colletotrichum fructicola]KAF4890420.1 hypothetical protein CGCFRS4_v008809 [Colletotrichum fructicola]KAF4900649.1 hypothetical protein CGCF415_v010005 [Colletotrichum fructicola]
MNNNKSGPGGPGNSSNPRPGQSPFPNSGPLVRQTPTNSQSSQPYTSSYSNNFDRNNSRYSTGRTDESRYSQENNDYTIPPRSPQRLSPPRQQPKREQAGRAWEDSIYGMYGDLKTPRDPPRQNQQSRRQYQQEDDDSYDEEVPRRPDPEPARPRPNRARTNPEEGPRRANTTRQNQQNERSGRSERRDRGDQQNRQDGRNADGNYRRVHINIDTGGDSGRSWTWSTDDRDRERTNVNIGTPFGGTGFGGSGPSLVNFGDSGFPFSGRNNGGGRLPVNVPFVNGLPVNLPFGL